MMRAAALVLLAGCGASPVLTAREPEPEPPPRERHAIALGLEEADPDEHETPRTRVLLVHIDPAGARRTIELGVEPGLCYHAQIPETLIAGECWWAGAGARFGLRRAGDVVVALRVEVDEETGASEAREVARVELPARATLDVLAPGRTVLADE